MKQHRSMPVVVAAPDSEATATPTCGLPEPPQSGGRGKCPKCAEMWDYLCFTPSGLCVVCAALADPEPTATPYSDPFWLLTPEEYERAEGELHRLTAETQRLADCLPDDDWGEAERPVMDRLTALDREALLLHLLYAASRQFRR
jgi:hypothetical protein